MDTEALILLHPRARLEAPSLVPKNKKGHAIAQPFFDPVDPNDF